MEQLRQLGSFIADLKFSDVPENVRQAALLHVLDTVGAAVGGAGEAQAGRIREKWLAMNPAGQNSVWGSGQKTAAGPAAFLNAMAGHTLEMDDVHTRSKTHIGTVVVPAAWAAAEYGKKSGADFLLAVICGYEVMSRIGMSFGVTAHRNLGWHVTATAGTFGAAAACAKLLGLDEEKATYVLGLAGAQSFGTWAFLGDGASCKVLNPARAAQCGLEAAFLAESGMSGPAHTVYDRLKIKKIYLANFIILQNCIMNILPWGGPTARVMSVLDLEAGPILAQLAPGMILSAIYVVGVSVYLGLKERKRLGIVDISMEACKVEMSEEELSWKRPKMLIPNLILTIVVIAALIMGLASSAILFGVGTAIALVMNYPDQKVQRSVISNVAPDMIHVVMMVLGAGTLMGVLNGPEDAGMSNAIAQFLVSIIPESLSRYFAVIIALLSAPGTYVLNQDAFYYGVLPPLAATAEAYGFTGLQIGVASLMGQAFHFLSPLVAFIYLLMDMCKISLAEYQAYICRWCIGIFVIFMVCGMGLGFIPIL